MRLARYRILLELRNQSLPQSIRVSWTRCHRRVQVLAALSALRATRGAAVQGVRRLFLSRACCGNAIYESQRRSRKGRAFLQAYRIRQQLGGSRPVVDAIPPRPRMAQKTYARLCARVARLEKPLIGSRVLRYAPRWIAPLGYYWFRQILHRCSLPSASELRSQQKRQGMRLPPLGDEHEFIWSERAYTHEIPASSVASESWSRTIAAAVVSCDRARRNLRPSAERASLIGVTVCPVTCGFVRSNPNLYGGYSGGLDIPPAE